MPSLYEHAEGWGIIFEREYPEPPDFFTPPGELIDYALINERDFEPPLGEIARMEYDASLLGKEEMDREGWKHLDEVDRESAHSSPPEGYFGGILVLPIKCCFSLFLHRSCLVLRIQTVFQIYPLSSIPV